jgi:hypothetical protein
MAQVVQCQPSKGKVLSSNPSTAQKKEEREKNDLSKQATTWIKCKTMCEAKEITCKRIHAVYSIKL